LRRGRLSLQLKFGNLALKGRHDRARRDLSCASFPVAGDPLLLCAPCKRVHDGAALLRIFEGDGQLIQRLVDQEIGRDEAIAPGRAHSRKLAIEFPRELGETAEISFCIRSILDRMIGVEELRRVDVRADVLDDDIGCVAPCIAGDRRIAIRKGQAFELGSIGIFHDLDAGPYREGQIRRVERFDPRKVGADSLGDTPLPSHRTIRKL